MSSKDFQNFDDEDDLEDFLESVLSPPHKKNSKKSVTPAKGDEKIVTEGASDKSNNAQSVDNNELEDSISAKKSSPTFADELLNTLDSTSSKEPFKSSLKKDEPGGSGKKKAKTQKQSSILDDLLNFDDYDIEEKNANQSQHSKTTSDEGLQKTNTFEFEEDLAGNYAGGKRQVRFQHEGDDNPLFSNTAPAALLSDVAKKDSLDWLTENPLEGLGTSSLKIRPKTVEGATKATKSFTESEDWLNELTSGVKTKNKEAIDSKTAKTEVLKVDTVSNAKSELNEKDSKSANKFNLDFLDSFGKEANKEATKQSTSDEPHVPRAKHHQLEELKEENAFLTHSIERLKQQHQQELSFVQAAHEKRLKLAEENFERCMETLKQGNEILSRDLTEKFELLGGERTEGFGRVVRCLSELEKQKAQEVLELREEYRRSLSEMKQDHDQALQRIMQDKDREMEVMMGGRAQLQKLDTTLEQLESNKQQLKELEKQLQCKAGELEEGREEDLKTRETALHKLHRELKVREMALEDERASQRALVQQLHERLSSLLSLQETHKTRLAEVERERQTVEEARRQFEGLMSRERAQLDSLKNGLEKERTMVTLELEREKERVAGERSRMEEMSRQQRENEGKERLKREKEERAMKKNERMLEEKSESVEMKAHELKELEEQLRMEKGEIERERNELKAERRKIAALNESVNEGSRELLHKYKELQRHKSSVRATSREVVRQREEAFSRNSLLETATARLNAKIAKLSDDCRFLVAMRQEVQEKLERSLCSRCAIHVNNNYLSALSNPYKQELSLSMEPL